MISKTFLSNRIKQDVTVIVSINLVHYIYENNDDNTDTIISIKRDVCYHINEDGLNRTIDLFEDPRFDYWLTNGEI